jgi:membrane associated rhomboid family serine protease
VIPIRDTIRSRRRPVVTYALIAANAAAFFAEVSAERALGASGFRDWIYRWALVPRDVARFGGVEEYETFVTSMFLHAGLMHLVGNMLYLWVFGRNVEDRMGRAGFSVFYILSGLAAAGTQFLIDPRLGVPVLGASGAVAGVLGAYIVLFPTARVVTLLPIFYFVTFVELPAVTFILIWFVFQNVFPAVFLPPSMTGGVAHWAHIGGFAFGVAVALLLRDHLRRPTIVWHPPVRGRFS